MKNNNLEWTNNKEFKNIPKTKKETYHLKTGGPSGEELICKCYNILDEIPTQKGGSMTRSEFEKLYAELSAKTEQRISDMLTTKFDQMEQKRLADKEELRQEINQKIDSIVVTINTNNTKQNEILQDLVARVTKLEEIVAKQGQDIAELKNDVAQLKVAVKELSLRMDRLEARMDALEARMDALETRMDNIEKRMDKLEARVTNLEDRVAIIEDEITELKKDKK